jgi:hypothetical protein
MQNTKTSGRGAVVTLQRREFLALGSAAMVGLAATDLRSDVLATLSTPMPLLSVGFWNGAAGDLTRDAEGAYRAVVAADRLAAADASLVREGARVTVQGFWRAESNRQPLSLALRAEYRDAGPNGETLPCIVWTWKPDSRVFHNIRFDMPVGETLDLTVERVQQQRAAARSLRSRFGLASVPAARAETAAMSPVSGTRGLKLRRGVYFFAIRENESESAPSWNAMRVATGASVLDPHGPGLLRLRGGRVPFSYLAVSVDAAGRA